ncbi:DUF6428 family protein [Hyunsoonleella pacifica]|uniref:Uncharacterized protein n=1 Tax=Hyunsoonleella pacifica TaxID=1080224 RepID=A0A4Q9FRI0_9FLAO|nr:DUF6428 family protein [Hyunsoonleella pacifica]TBN16307.1 hypothetical protein EYD46_06575 [Hyunsoonleella pacifica]GGD20561.1 hypothetical protein GCM10011368_23120 [Hyunsoonleella pacifica]
MRTQEFFSILESNKDKTLLFEYAEGVFVSANYHITEVKHISIDSVDCGAGTDSWRETIIQLWESPEEHDKTEYMSVLKALGILNKVGRMKPFVLDAEVKFEYSNETFHTAQLFVNDFEIRGHNLIFKLAVEKTDCKAKEACGISSEEKVTSTNEACCSPNSGCC